MKRVSLLLALLCILVPSISLAQEVPGINSPLSIIVAPTTPSPNETVNLQAQSSSFDIDTSYITWTGNGKILSKGTGDKTLLITSGILGSSTKITASATTADGQNFSASTTIDPAFIGLVWEANTYTPPFYLGKALRSWGASYKVVAIPEVAVNGVLLKPGSLIYTWSKNNSVDASVSGYGKSTYQGDTSVSYTRGGDDIDVKVSTSDGTVVGENSVAIPVTQAQMLMYQDSPIYGVLYNQAITTSTTLNGNSIALRAEPFFFSDLTSAIGSIVWTINGDAVPTFAGDPSITLTRQDKNAGTSIVGASLQSPFALLQAAQKSVTININAEQ